MWADEAIALIKQHGLYGLGGSDGCRCVHFHIQGVSIDVSCHKSEHCIRVWSNYIYREASELERIAREVLFDLSQTGADVDSYRLRFCKYSDDHVGGHWEVSGFVHSQKCCYCGKPRNDRETYLCCECSSNPEAREHFPWICDGFAVVTK
jgi:hypothetical protein